MQARPLNLVRPEVPAELAGVVATMMAKDPARRYRTPADVVEALAPFASEDSMTSDREPRDLKPRPTRLTRSRKVTPTESWPDPPGRLDGGRQTSGLLAKLKTPAGRIGSGLVAVLLTGLAFALVHFDKPTRPTKVTRWSRPGPPFVKAGNPRRPPASG